MQLAVQESVKDITLMHIFGELRGDQDYDEGVLERVLKSRGRTPPTTLVTMSKQKEKNMDEERFIELETRIAFQEQTIKTLSDVMYEQQKKIDKLEELYVSLEKPANNPEKLQPGANLIHEKPPHY